LLAFLFSFLESFYFIVCCLVLFRTQLYWTDTKKEKNNHFWIFYFTKHKINTHYFTLFFFLLYYAIYHNFWILCWGWDSTCIPICLLEFAWCEGCKQGVSRIKLKTLGHHCCWMSLMSAIAAGQLVNSHMKYNRSSKDLTKISSSWGQGRGCSH